MDPFPDLHDVRNNRLPEIFKDYFSERSRLFIHIANNIDIMSGMFVTQSVYLEPWD